LEEVGKRRGEKGRDPLICGRETDMVIGRRSVVFRFPSLCVKIHYVHTHIYFVYGITSPFFLHARRELEENEED
jgi:hypothetical protein